MFGKKKRALLAEPTDQPRMSASVTEFMEKLGLSDEDIAEMANPISDQQRRIDESEAALASFVKQTNAYWSQTTGALIDLQPRHMLPTSCWDFLDTQDTTLFMDVLGLLPAQPWNIVLLAMNDETARLVGVGRHHVAPSDEHLTAINLAQLTIAEELDQVKQKQGATLQPSVFNPALLDPTVDDPPPLQVTDADVARAADFDSIKNAATARIMAMARPVAAAALGQAVVDQSRSIFFHD